jgi:hypothetical protein
MKTWIKICLLAVLTASLARAGVHPGTVAVTAQY